MRCKSAGFHTLRGLSHHSVRARARVVARSIYSLRRNPLL